MYSFTKYNVISFTIPFRPPRFFFVMMSGSTKSMFTILFRFRLTRFFFVLMSG